MNDLQFKKQLQAAPFQLDEEMKAYLQSHPELNNMVKNSQQFDQQIKKALQTDTPEGLEARILLQQSYVEKNLPPPILEQRKSNFWRHWGAMVASVMLVVGGLGLWQERATLFPLKATDVIAHVVHHMEDEPDFMRVNKSPENEQELQALFLAVGATLDQPIEHMSYAGECVINGQKGLHIVLQEPEGPVTIIIMPGQQLAAMEAFEASGYQGELLPVKGGIVAIMGKGRKQVALAHMRFFKAVKFV
ncbi:hypothetical protein MNBD_GAMMA04-850 [hydrothermal vent metagenome]|uniref:DUF3379 domain-containing protein n=1 Tax=hydrothermal vent metagenome TaxID=652676 RepID=A0A3B0W878_9ZZZZ